MVVDAININRSRFTKWAEEWLTIPSELYYGGYIRDLYMKDIIEVLLDKKVFTVCELLAEFSNKKIYIPEKIKMHIIKKYTEEK